MYILKSYILPFLSLLPFLIPADAVPVPDGTQIGAIHVKGQKRYTESQIVLASGLKVGQNFELFALNAATQKLGETGAFEEVTFSYKSSSGKVTVEFAVKEAAKFHRCTFDNFVWAADQELQDHLKEEISLYDGFAPDAGNFADQIAASLGRFNRAHGVPYPVESTHFGALGDSNWSFMFVTKGPVIKISSLQFQGVKQLDEGLLRRAAQPLLTRTYSSIDSGLFAHGTFTSIYKDRGFLQVSFAAPSSKITKHLEGSADFEVEVAYSIAEGLAYDWQEPDWNGNQVLAAKKLTELMGLKSGQRADASKIDHGWDALQNAYTSRGYMDFAIRPEPLFDDPNHSVRYKVAISEGPQYHMGNLSIAGVPPATADKLKDRWPMKQTDIYDASYLMKFETNVMFPVLGSHPRVISTVRPDRNTLTVDVTLRVE
ncbi:MAG TPA: POTRA domain-containing protein [Candidatus Acidoferrum sp.]|jgi:outer membrane protein assembly factor BamA